MKQRSRPTVVKHYQRPDGIRNICLIPVRFGLGRWVLAGSCHGVGAGNEETLE